MKLNFSWYLRCRDPWAVGPTPSPSAPKALACPRARCWRSGTHAPSAAHEHGTPATPCTPMGHAIHAPVCPAGHAKPMHPAGEMCPMGHG